MDSKRLLTVMAERLYEDIKFVTQQNPVQIVDEDGARAFNALLNRARRHFPGAEPLADFSEWSPRAIKYKDALVVSGQLHAMLRALTGDQRPVRPQGAVRTPVSSGGHPGSPPPRYTSEAPRAPSDTQVPRVSTEDETSSAAPRRPQPQHPRPASPQRNEDGTIPFSLD